MGAYQRIRFARQRYRIATTNQAEKLAKLIIKMLKALALIASRIQTSVFL